MSWPRATFPIMGKEFRLVRRHVDVHWTFALTSFAGKAQIQRFFHILITPAAGNHIAMQHLPKVVSTSASGMALFMRDHETRTHNIIVGILPLFAATLSDPDAAQCGMGEASVVVGESEVSFRLPRMVIGAQPEI